MTVWRRARAVGYESVAGLYRTLQRRMPMDGMEATARRLGVERAARRWRTRAAEAMTPAEVTIEIDGSVVRFQVGGRFEYEQFESYLDGPDRSVLRDFLDRLEPTDTIWDVGANVGIFTCFAAARFDADRVIAIEPHPRNCARITENLDLNGRTATVHQYALSSFAGEMTMVETGPETTGTFGREQVAKAPADRTGREVVVDAERGDTFAASGRLPTPTVLKIDVQGGEQESLKGLKGTLADEQCRLVYCNVYEKHFDSPAQAGEIEALLRDAGLVPTRIADWSGGYFLRAERT